MTLAVHTARMGYRGDDWLDVSLQGNERRHDKGEIGGHRGVGLVFAPSPLILYPYLSKRRFGKLTDRDWPEYREKYTADMRESYRKFRRAWDTVLSWDRVVFLCFCPNANECHRTVLAEIFVRCGATYAGEIARAA